MTPYWSDCVDNALLLAKHEQVSRAVIGESVPGGKVGQTRLQAVSQLCPYNCAAVSCKNTSISTAVTFTVSCSDQSFL